MFKLNPSERLLRWREFRKDLDSQDLPTACQSVIDFWSNCPFSPYYLDHDYPELWPDPWTLIEENYYCDLAKALGIVYTLYLTDHRPEMEIRVYNDLSTKEQYNLVLVNQGKYVLNLVHDEVVNKEQIEKNLKLSKTLSIFDLGLDKIQ